MKPKDIETMKNATLLRYQKLLKEQLEFILSEMMEVERELALRENM